MNDIECDLGSVLISNKFKFSTRTAAFCFHLRSTEYSVPTTESETLINRQWPADCGWRSARMSQRHMNPRRHEGTTNTRCPGSSSHRPTPSASRSRRGRLLLETISISTSLR